jgi:hypothetical protein
MWLAPGSASEATTGLITGANAGVVPLSAPARNANPICRGGYLGDRHRWKKGNV